MQVHQQYRQRMPRSYPESKYASVLVFTPRALTPALLRSSIVCDVSVVLAPFNHEVHDLLAVMRSLALGENVPDSAHMTSLPSPMISRVRRIDPTSQDGLRICARLGIP